MGVARIVKRVSSRAAAAVLLAAALPTMAAELHVLADLDADAGTGCTIATPGGPFPGIEQRFVTTIDTTVNPPLVTGVTREACAGGVFGPPTVVSNGGWTVGVGLGTAGDNVVESGMPIPPGVTRLRLGFLYIDPVSGTDTLLALPGGGPIVLALPGFVVAVPALSPAMLLLLAALLGGVAYLHLRRKGFPAAPMMVAMLALSASMAWAAIVLDGFTGDWNGIRPIASDPTGDAPAGSDISALFAAVEGGTLFVRADVMTGLAPAASADAFNVTAPAALNIAAPGVLSNDARGLPAATVMSFGGGALPGSVTTNAPGATAAFAGGTLVLNANGSLLFTPAPGFTGTFSFAYRMGNASNTADGGVTITVRQAPAITSANSAVFTVGTFSTFTVTATGGPAPTIALASGALPAGVTFNAATAVLSGTPASGTAGIHALAFTAGNGIPPNAVQGFTFEVREAPAANADSYSTVHDTPLTIAAPGVLSNDSGTPLPNMQSVTGSATTCAAFPCTVATLNGSVLAFIDGSFVYTPAANFAGSDSFSYTNVNGVASASATVTLTVTNAAPVLDLNGPGAGIDFGPVAWVEGGTSVALVDPAQLTVDDADSTQLSSARVSLAPLPDAGSEQLLFTCALAPPDCIGAIQLSDIAFDPALGMLAVSRVASLADYQVLLATLRYDNTSVSPTGTARTISFVVNDGIVDSAVAQSEVALTAQNNAPTVAAPASAAVSANTPFTFAGTVSVADIDSGNAPVQVTLDATHGIATLSTTAGLSVTGNGSAHVVAVGTLASQNAALAGMTYTPDAGYFGAATLGIEINDLGNTGSGGPRSATRSVAITVNTPPTVVSTAPALAATNVSTATTIALTFSEPVNATAASFSLECPPGAPRAFTAATAGNSVTLTPAAPLPGGSCVAIARASGITDVDAGQNMAADFPVFFTTAAPPQILSAAGASFAKGSGGVFNVITNGFFGSGMVLTATGVPAGVTFSDNGNGTALVNVPAITAAAAGDYALAIRASNGSPPDAVQNFTLTLTCPAVTWSPLTLPGGVVGSPYGPVGLSVTPPSSGPLFLTVVGAAPPGIAVFGSQLQGAPFAAGTYNFSLQYTEFFSGCTYTQPYAMSVVEFTANNDSYGNIVGNVRVDSASAGFSVADNDSVPAGATISAYDATTASGGTVSMITAGPNLGRFTYDPPRGYEGPDSFTYTLAAGSATRTATVSFNIAGMVWFVDNRAGACPSGPCDGRQGFPYTTIDAFRAANGMPGRDPQPNQSIHVAAGGAAYWAGGAITVLDGQRMIGQGASATFAAASGLAAGMGQRLPDTQGAMPNIVAAIEWRNNSRLVGFDMDGASVALGASNATGFVVDLHRVRQTSIAGQSMLRLAGARNTGSLTFASLGAVGDPAAGSRNAIDIAGLTGTLTVTGTDFGLSPPGGTIYNFGGNGLRVSLWAATCTFAGTCSGDAIVLRNMRFDNNARAQAFAGDNLNCTGPSGIDSGGGGCYAHLDLSSVDGLLLENVALVNSGQMGLVSINSFNFTLRGGSIDNNGDGASESGLYLSNVFGRIELDGMTLRGNTAFQMVHRHANGPVRPAITIRNSAFDNAATVAASPGLARAGILLRSESSSPNHSITIENSTFTNFGNGNAIEFQAAGAPTAVITNNTFDNAAAGVVMKKLWSAPVNLDIANNRFSRMELQSILYSTQPDASGVLRGTISGNTIGTGGAGSACRGGNCLGIDIDHGDSGGAIQVAVVGNTVQQVANGFGIYVHGEGSGSVDARIANNTLLAPAGSVGGGQGEAIHVSFASGASSTVSACTDIRNNNISGGGATTWGSGGSGADIYLRHRTQAGSNIALPGYAGGPTDVGAVMAFVTGNNGGATSYADTTGPAPNGFVGSAGCSTP